MEILDSYREEMWARATAQWGFMPEVCDEGIGCRQDIWARLTADVEAEWR